MTAEADARLNAIRDHVRAGGRRWTFAKNAIVGTLMDAERHLSPRRIYETLLPAHPQLDHSTVYRALQVLVDEGVVHSLDRRGEARYGLADRPHHHVVCGDCGRVAEVAAADGVQELLTMVGSRTGFSFAGQSLTLTGRCARCSTASAAGGGLDGVLNSEGGR
ncbi:Fur family transcriptional regulator [Actinoplanes sp. CA-030573]|uniref:Fur family transcriptional regulator n=1 Tax=Actinoplanes sp. CA-030573 TaxID=3239898 RepID=UPI003D8E1BB3